MRKYCAINGVINLNWAIMLCKLSDLTMPHHLGAKRPPPIMWRNQTVISACKIISMHCYWYVTGYRIGAFSTCKDNELSDSIG